MKRTVAVYTRVSTDMDSQKKSLEYQREQYLDYCNINGFELYDLYSDTGTGTNVRNRPNFVRMLADASLDYSRNDKNGYDNFDKSTTRKPKFDYIIVKDVSRFSRNSHLGLLVAEYLRDQGVYIIFENSGLNTEIDDWYLRLSLLFIFAQEESRSLSRRIKFSKQHNISKDIYNPSRLSFGYYRNDKKEIVVNEEEAEVVKLIFKLYKDKGALLVAKELNELGYKSQNGHDWSSDKILRIIRNKLYAGIGVVNKSTKTEITDTHRQKIDKDKWKEIPNAVESIISLSDWEEANIKRSNRINSTSRRGRKPAINDDFYQKIYCGKCGNRFSRHQGKNNPNSKIKLSYMCQKRRKDGITVCDSRSISFNILDDMLNQTNVNTLFNRKIDKIKYYNLLSKIDEESMNMKKRTEFINDEIAKLESESDKITDALIEKLSASQAVTDRLTKKIEKNESEIEQLNSQLKSYSMPVLQKLKAMLEATMKAYKGLSELPHVPRERKLKLLEKIIVNDYDVSFNFIQASFYNETELFNVLFPMAQIKNEAETEYTGFTIKREHKEAIEYWEKFVE